MPCFKPTRFKPITFEVANVYGSNQSISLEMFQVSRQKTNKKREEISGTVLQPKVSWLSILEFLIQWKKKQQQQNQTKTQTSTSFSCHNEVKFRVPEATGPIVLSREILITSTA